MVYTLFHILLCNHTAVLVSQAHTDMMCRETSSVDEFVGIT